MSDLFQSAPAQTEYTAQSIEVLEGLEPVRRRPGMYVGGTDDRALHHLVAEVLDNSMDEAVAGFASRIDLVLDADGTVTIRDNGRGIPVDPHPKFPDKSALEVILTTLHSGGKFSDKVYQTSGGLHGVGVSVVNALSDRLVVEVARDRSLWRQQYSRGTPMGPIEGPNAAPSRRGTTIAFHPDPEIFGEKARFKPATLYKMARSKAYLFKGVEIRWRCDPALVADTDEIPSEETLHFPGGLVDFLAAATANRPTVTQSPFAGEAEMDNGAAGRVEWAVHWPTDGRDTLFNAYCNTVPTPLGGTHEQGLRQALTRALKAYGDLIGVKKAAQITADDVLGESAVLLSVFIRDPQFQGQTKERLVSPEAARLVEQAIKDRFDHWLADQPDASKLLLLHVIERADERLARRKQKETQRKTATKRLRLPGKLADCSSTDRRNSEIFLVEGDSAGGSAKQARDRASQAVLPLRGKILNVASASQDKMKANQELQDLILALGCGSGKQFDVEGLRYDRVIIMTDADVDGAHIASLLMTFFFREMRGLITGGHLYLAQPPLYRLQKGATVAYARDDAHREELLATTFRGNGKIETSRFKGLGEMPSGQLKETTMDPKKRILLRVALDDPFEAADRVEQLMGRKAEARFKFIQENASFAGELDV
ncbi:MAG: DNA topoisomerase IV subunit B [Alphaproteobacteria bacterium]|nr:DNA topoisomerase IV subunit B [Alphaproteobacteria bacterium]